MKSVYTGGEKVAEFESYDELRVGDGKPAFIYEGSELVYPNPVKDRLVLWYDFSGRTNADGQRGIAEDLSGNGNHGTLKNFNYTPESGYDKNKLLFDGVDDYIDSGNFPSLNIEEELTLEVVTNIPETRTTQDILTKGVTYGGRQNYSLSVFSNGNLYFEVNDSNWNRYTLITLVPKNETLFIQGIANSEGVKLYVNGELQHSSLEPIPNLGLTVRGLYIGGTRYCNSLVYSARIYHKALTSEEIAHNYAIEKERFGIE